MLDIDAECKEFLNSNIVKAIKFDTLDYFLDSGLPVFTDRVLNFMWHSWLASANRAGYKLIPVEIKDRKKWCKLLNTHDSDLDERYKLLIECSN